MARGHHETSSCASSASASPERCFFLGLGGWRVLSGLRVLGVNLLGRFLSSRELNVKYVALGTLQQVVKVDSKAVMRHRDTLLECLKVGGGKAECA